MERCRICNGAMITNRTFHEAKHLIDKHLKQAGDEVKALSDSQPVAQCMHSWVEITMRLIAATAFANMVRVRFLIDKRSKGINEFPRIVDSNRLMNLLSKEAEEIVESFFNGQIHQPPFHDPN